MVTLQTPSEPFTKSNEPLTNPISLVLDGATTDQTNFKQVREGTLKYIQERLTEKDAVAVFALVYLGFWTLTGVPIYLASVALGPLVGTFGGVEAKPIKIEKNGMRRSVSIPGVLDIAIEGVKGAKEGEPIYFDNVGHPAATRLALAKASRGHLHAFGIDWDDTSGRNNGHFAPFAWSSS